MATIEDPQPGFSGDSNAKSSHQPRRFQKNLGSVLRKPKKNKEARVYMQPPIEAAAVHSDEVCLFYSILWEHIFCICFWLILAIGRKIAYNVIYLVYI